MNDVLAAHRQAFEHCVAALQDCLFEQHGGDLSRLLPDAQALIQIWRLDADMYSGGFLQYFCNRGKQNLRQVQNILKHIGAQRSLAILKENEALIAPLQHDNRIKKLWDIPLYLEDHLNADQLARLDTLDAEYWANPDDRQVLCCHAYPTLMQPFLAQCGALPNPA